MMYWSESENFAKVVDAKCNKRKASEIIDIAVENDWQMIDFVLVKDENHQILI